MLLCLTAGCASTSAFTPPWKKADATKIEGPKDSVTLTGGGLVREPIDPKTRAELDTAQRLMSEQKYTQAESLYHKLAAPGHDPDWWQFDIKLFEKSLTTDKSKKYSRAIYEEALFGEAECQRLQKNYRSASETYTRLLVAVPNGQFTRRACQGLFEIADYWLEPTRRQMDEYQDQLKGGRWFVTPAMYFHFNKEMPMMDAEGHATNILNTIRLHDINGPMGEKALFYLGTVNFFRKEYKEADFYFTQLYQQYPNSEQAPKAVKQSVICKQLMTGGTEYDLRTVEESKKLLMTAQGAYPELVKDDKWVETQLKTMNVQQADRDLKIAEFYERTGHPGSAYFYYELVCRRYPRTKFAEQAEKRKGELRGKAQKEQAAYNEQTVPLNMPRPVLEGSPLQPPAPSNAPRVLPPGIER